MAALRLLTRSELSAIILRSGCRHRLSDNVSPAPIQIQKRWGTYKSSPEYDENLKYADYEVTRDPEEWKYVKRLLKPKLIPEPKFENKSYPSGWKPPTSKPGDHPYYVQRTKNYMLPVYLEISFRGLRRITTIKKIQGDIWTLEAELKQYLETATNKIIGIRINELTGEIKLRGDYVSLVKEWMHSKGF
ncbi:mitochondrial ribosomal protein L49 [Nomia melanderi]|uniref:mitochondrial ribosomal protein L49 n=1 Tax=Nomia melanderi TaxID=2448451 RepID=UPI001304654E|nr:probable 39S ribosomal protein L49, mitochondrial [Nomia melanderi]